MSINMREEITLTSEVYQLFHEHGHMFEKPRQVWTSEQMATVYHIYNTLTGKNDRDTGCGSCRTTHVNYVRRAYEQYKQSL